MEPEEGNSGSPFAQFCNERLQAYMCAEVINIPTRMLVLGVEDEGRDAYYFANRGFQVTGIDRVAEPRSVSFVKGNARFLKMSLEEFFKLPEAKQSYFHAVYCCILHKLCEDKRELVLQDSFYLLRPSGWLMLDLDPADIPTLNKAQFWRLRQVYQHRHDGFVRAIFRK